MRVPFQIIFDQKRLRFQLAKMAWWMLVFQFGGLNFGKLVAQNFPDSINLKPVEIRATRLNEHANGLKINKLDSLAVGSTLADALASQPDFWVANYGPGSLATISTRGAGSQRTAVLWNGLPLSSTMNGVADGSLFPLFSGDEISLQTGGSSSLNGSGAIGGAILIQPFFPKKTGFSGEIGLNGGSFGEIQPTGSLFFKSRKGSSIGFRGNFQEAKNDFPFQNTTIIGAPNTSQTNAALKKTDIQQLNRVFFNEKNVLTTALWLTESWRQIPPSMTEAAKIDWQKDTAFRASANLISQLSSSLSLRTGLGWMYESILFKYSLGEEFSRAKTLLGEAEIRLHRNRSISRFGVLVDGQQAYSAGYGGEFTRQNTALFLAQTIDFQQISCSWSVRSQFTDGKWKPLTGSIGLEKKDNPEPLKWRIHLSKNWRQPTFNDLFWASGGNPNLLSESGWNAEAGLFLKTKTRFFQKMEADLTAFSLWMDDYIDWKPSIQNPNFFTARNHKKVWSAGLEGRVKLEFQLSKWQFSTSTAGRFNHFKNLKFYQSEPQNEPIRQPNWQSIFRFVAKYGAWSFDFSQNRTGFSSSLAGLGYKNYGFANLTVHFSKSCWQTKADFFVQIRNLFDEKYQVIPFRAMPGRSFRAGIRFSI